MKKRLLTLVLVAAMVLSLTACGGGADDSATQPAETEEAAPAEEEAPEEEAAPVEEEAPEEEAAMTLEDWMQTEEAALTEEMTNSALASQGITVKLVADGNVFVYEYTMPDSMDYSDVTTEQLAANFEPVIEQNKSGMADLFSTFESEYGITLEGARFTFFAADGTELYSGDVANE